MSTIEERPNPDHGVAVGPFRQLAESAPIGMVHATASGIAQFVNQAWRDITGVTEPTPIAFETINDIVHPDDRQRIIDMYLEAAETLVPFETELRLVRPEGGVRHVRIQGRPHLVEGEIEGFTGTILDITDVVEAKEAREHSENRYRDLMAKAPIGQAVYALDGRLVEINEAGAAQVGYTPEEMVGMRAIDLLALHDRPLLAEPMAELLDGRRSSFQDEHELLHRDGRTVWVANNVTIERDREGRPLHFHVLNMDITERKLAEAKLQASEARYRKLIDEAPVGQLLSRLDGELVEVNQAFLDMMGETREEAFARPPEALLHPHDAAAFAEQIPRLLSGEIDTIDRERRLVRTDGSLVWVSGGTSLIREGDELFLHAVMHDITERKQVERRLRSGRERATAVIGSLHEGLLIFNDREVILANESACRFLDIPAEELVGPIDRLLLLEDLDATGQPGDSATHPATITLSTGVPQYGIERATRTNDGEVRWALVNTVPLMRRGQDLPHAVVMSFTDITERRLASDALEQSENRFRTMTESLPVGVYQADAEGAVVYVNPQMREVVGLDRKPETYEDAMEPVHAEDVGRVARGLAALLDGAQGYSDQYRMVGDDGTIRWVSHRARPTLDEAGNVTGIIGSIEDVTALIAAQEQNMRLASIIESTADLVGIIDAETTRLIYLNRSAREVFGLVDQALSEFDTASLYPPETMRTFQDQVLPVLLRNETWVGELPMVDDSGREMVVWQSQTPTLRADGTLDQISVVGRDITERRRFEQDLAYQATHDSLTGLPNRALLLDHLEMALARAERDNRLIALLFLDLDRFKMVNDLHGHDAGDELLAQTARLISEVVRPSDTVARLGGDEFVILCDDVDDEEHAVAVAHRIAAAIESSPYYIGSTNLAISASIGIAMAAGGAGHPEALLRDADAAMYRAKDLGRARLEIYDESMRRRSAHRLELSEQLAEGIEIGDIVVRFQPGIDTVSGRVTCVEALARWQHPTRGLLAPSEFIGLAEETGLIVGLGLRVLSTACEHGRRWEQEYGPGAPRVHVNLSARQLTTSNLPVLVQGVLDGSGLTPSQLCLEITESVLMDDASSVIDTLWALKGIGVMLAIDDFGTGYSSLSYLRRFPVDVLKVDQSFIAGLGPDPEDSTIVAAIVNLATTLELEAIAEGVETREQVERLQALGCNLAQGYYFAEPVEPDSISSMIEHGFPPRGRLA
jgi:diguanylate cyclase (GGDEF)-like protein/PAS domain S-box-containing protein